MSHDRALQRITELHRPKKTFSVRHNVEFDICDYDKTEWPCTTRAILEQEKIVPKTPDKPLDPKPWSWGLGTPDDVRQATGPGHDSVYDWSRFDPRPGYEQDDRKYPREQRPDPRWKPPTSV